MKKLQQLTGAKILSKKEQQSIKGGVDGKNPICNCAAPDGTADCTAWCEPCHSGQCN